MYSGYNSFVRYVIWKYFLLVFVFCFHSLHIVFCKVCNFDEISLRLHLWIVLSMSRLGTPPNPSS